MESTDRPKTRKQVEKYLAANGVVTEVAKGDGYFYFWGDVESGWFSSSVSVARVSDLTLGDWLETYRQLAADYRNL